MTLNNQRGSLLSIECKRKLFPFVQSLIDRPSDRLINRPAIDVEGYSFRLRADITPRRL